MDAMHQGHELGFPPEPHAWNIRRKLLEFLETCWDLPDDGIWEMRGPPRQFTHSKVMAWVAFDRGIKRIEALGSRGPLERWRALRARLKDEICRCGFDTELGSFVQYYGSKALDASLLMMPLVGFLPASDPRIRGTVRAIEETLLEGGLVRRYQNRSEVDGLPGGEGVFLPCTFWLVDNLALAGRLADARRLFGRLLDLRNDVGLLSEEYDVHAARLVGNFPQAFTHVSLVNTARTLTLAETGTTRRATRG
jgi:GH15 family glucan-1,4-alpha-glucosidase